MTLGKILGLGDGFKVNWDAVGGGADVNVALCLQRADQTVVHD